MSEQREKFEQWARSNNVQLTLDLDREYYYPQAKAAWAAWQECHKQVLEMEARKDAAYLERNQVVAALAKAFPSGVGKTAIEGWSEDWHGCVYIDLPTGQASWHFHDSQAYLFDGIPAYPGTWDGHSTEEKYERLAKLTLQSDFRDLRGVLGLRMEQLKELSTDNEKLRTQLRKKIQACPYLIPEGRPCPKCGDVHKDKDSY